MGKSEKKLRGKGNERGGNTLSNINIRNRHATAAQSSPIISGAKNVHSTFYTPRLGAPSQFQNSSPYLAYFKFQRPAEKIGAQSDFSFVVLTSNNPLQGGGGKTAKSERKYLLRGPTGFDSDLQHACT